MKKKLLVLLIAAIPILIPNLASATAIEVGGYEICGYIFCEPFCSPPLTDPC